MILPIKLLDLTVGLSLWNVSKTIFGKHNYKIIHGTSVNDTSVNGTSVNGTSVNGTNVNGTSDTSVLKVYYPQGSSSPSKNPVGGLGFYATPSEITNATDVTLNYSVKFDKTFDPVIGGKLPGLFINDNGNLFGGSGGKHTNNTSCRVAWRSNFIAEAYVYLPKYIQQNTSYYNNTIKNAVFGDSVWRGEFQFDNKNWNNVTLRIRLNTFTNTVPKMDGILELTINDVKRGLYDIIWTTQPNSKVETLIFETFFGGSSPKAVTPNDTWSYFKNVSVVKNS